MLFTSIPVDVTAVSSVVLQPRVMMICSCLFFCLHSEQKRKASLNPAASPFCFQGFKLWRKIHHRQSQRPSEQIYLPGWKPFILPESDCICEHLYKGLQHVTGLQNAAWLYGMDRYRVFHLQVNNATVEKVSVESTHYKSILEPAGLQRNVQGLIMFMRKDLQSRF